MTLTGLIILNFFILFINTYFCGKIVKRFSKEINDFLAFTFGFFIFVGLFQLFILPIMIMNVSANTIFFTYLTYQSILLIIYIINWRWSLSKLFISWKQFLISIIGIIIVLTILYGFRNYKYTYQYDINLDNLLRYGNQYILNSIMISFAYKANILNFNVVLNNSYIFIYAILIAFGIYGMYFYDKQDKWYLTISYFVIVNIISICSLTIFTSPSNGNCWILFTISLLIFNHIININNKNYKIGIANINFITLALFAICPDSLYVIIMINLYLLFMSYLYKFENVMDYNIRGMFGCLLAIFLFIKLNTNNYLIWIGIYILIIFYIIYYIIRKTKILKPINNFFNNISINTINFLTAIFAISVFLIGMFITTIPGDFKFNSAPWIISNFMNKNLKYGTWMFWLINVIYYLINVLIVIYTFITYKNKKIQMYIENIRLTPLIGINTITFWNPISTNFWSSISFKNYYAVSNGFLNSFSPAFINFCYYLINKKKWSKSLSILLPSCCVVSVGLILLNLL